MTTEPATIAWWTAGTAFVVHAALFAIVRRGIGRLPELGADAADAPPTGGDGRWPTLSIVVAARDEERNLERAMRSLLAIDYPDAEVVAVDDRSSDRTGEILDRLAAESSGRPPGAARLRVVHVRELPAGWLGKCHALHVAGNEARGELVLFTDADVEFSPHALQRAVRCLVERRADHLTVLPDIHMPGVLLTAFSGAFALYFTVFTRAWDAPDPASKAHVGVGAFNLVRASAWRAVGGHAPIALRPDDDLKLAKLLKKNGHRAAVAAGTRDVSVEWYRTLGELVRGLEKNMFAGVEYSVAAVLVSTVLQLALWVAPFALPFVIDGPPRWLAIGALAAMFGAYVAANRWTRARWWTFGLLPVTTILFLWCFVRSTTLALVRGGIVWRETHYPLSELRANRV